MKIKKIFLYGTTHLPEEGWFQGCIHCDTITANTRHFKTIKKPVYIPRITMCPPLGAICPSNFKMKSGLSDK